MLLMAIFSTILLGIGTASCSLMDTDRSDCPEGLYVNFVYDYNIQRSDMFKDHVGYVTVYVFDESDNLVMKRSVGNYGEDRPLSVYGYRMHFTPEELPIGKYRLLAFAMQKDWDEALATPGAKYRRSEPEVMTRGTLKGELGVVLDRGDKNADGLCPVSNVAPMDTLWHGTLLNATEAEVKFQEPTYATISMVRDTKTLNITLRDIDAPADPTDDKYAVTIKAANGRLGWDNTVLPDDTLLYTPYAAWTTQYPENAQDGDPELQRTAHYDINFNRLMYTDNQNEMAVLKLVNRNNGKVIGNFNLAYLLSEGRTAYEFLNYSRQEYLDREYNYRLDFVLKGDRWSYITISVGILSWTRRIVNEEL